MRLSLRFRSNLVTTLVALLTFATVAALAVTTTRMSRMSHELTEELETVRVTSELWSGLLYFSYMHRIALATGDPSFAAEAQRMEEQLRGDVTALRQWIRTPREAAVVEEVARTIEGFLARPEPEPGTREEVTGRELENERALLMALRNRTIARAHAIAAATESWAQTARLLGIATLLVVAVCLGLSMWDMRRRVVLPLRRIRCSLQRLRQRSFRPVPEEGGTELLEISRALNDSARDLRRQRERAMSFVSAVAHDLRNPLQALKLATTLRPNQPLPSEERMRERFALIARQADRLEQMVEDLLDTTRIEAGQLSLRMDELDLVHLVDDAIALHRGLSDRHVLLADVPERPLYIRGDSTRLSQVFNNLVNNAIKYSPRGGEVRIELREEPGRVCVAVADQGVGIASDERETIFQPFRRSKETRDRIPGVGLGLAVSRSIVEAHGGEIVVESEPGRGSTFCVRLPRVAETHRAIREPHPSLHA